MVQTTIKEKLLYKSELVHEIVFIGDFWDNPGDDRSSYDFHILLNVDYHHRTTTVICLRPNESHIKYIGFSEQLHTCLIIIIKWTCLREW